jgi:hypothetical protein
MPIILATWEAEIGRVIVQSRQKVCKTPFKQWLGVVEHTYHLSYTGKHKQEEINWTSSKLET